MSPRAILAALLAANLIKYLDRQVLFPLLPLIKSDLALSDAELGALASAFMLVYTLAAMPAGWLADRGRRPLWLAGATAAWSLATAAGAAARGYLSLLALRGLAGAGQSAFSSAAPALVAERWPKEKRGGALALFSLAIPVGSALGYLLGGAAGHRFGWRATLMAAGLIGLPVALWVSRIRDPRGVLPESAAPKASDYLALYRIPSYLAATCAMTLMTFALGGLAVWMPTYLTRYFSLNVAQAGLYIGALSVGAGLLGSLLGGWLGDRWAGRNPAGYFLVSAAGLFLALPAAGAVLVAGTLPAAAGLFFLAETFAFLNMGPLNAVFTWVVDAPRRSMAFAANIVLIHALGDAISPWLIGAASDRWGLRTGLLGAILFLGLAGAVCLWGARHLARDSAAVDERTI